MKATVTPGQKVLINGAAGGIGTFAVQIAKSLGAEGTGVCSTENVEMVRSLGADLVINYTQEDFTNNGRHAHHDSRWPMSDGGRTNGALGIIRVFKALACGRLSYPR